MEWWLSVLHQTNHAHFGELTLLGVLIGEITYVLIIVLWVALGYLSMSISDNDISFVGDWLVCIIGIPMVILGIPVAIFIGLYMMFLPLAFLVQSWRLTLPMVLILIVIMLCVDWQYRKEEKVK